MPREARLFDSADGLPTAAFLKLNVNIPPNWIGRARKSRKTCQSGLVKAIRKVRRLLLKRPRARVSIRKAQQELRRELHQWELAFKKECFYHGLRVLLELERTGFSKR